MNEQELREDIASKIDALHVDKSWTYDVDIAQIIEEITKIVRGK
jgi:hypothetical protein